MVFVLELTLFLMFDLFSHETRPYVGGEKKKEKKKKRKKNGGALLSIIGLFAVAGGLRVRRQLKSSTDLLDSCEGMLEEIHFF